MSAACSLARDGGSVAALAEGDLWGGGGGGQGRAVQAAAQRYQRGVAPFQRNLRKQK